MKLRFPKKLHIGDTAFTVKLNPKSGNASFLYWDEKDKKITGGEIVIGTFHLKSNPIRVLSEIIHELKRYNQFIVSVESSYGRLWGNRR